MVARPRTELKTLRLAQPAVRSTSRLEVTAVGLLTLTATSLWLFVLPLELLGFLSS